MEKNESLTYQNLIKNGFNFTIEKRFTGRFSQLKKRTFHIESPVLRTYTRLCFLFMKLKFDETIIENAPYTEDIELTRKYRKTASKLIAHAILRNYSVVPLSVPLLAWYLRGRINNMTLLNLIVIISHLSADHAYMSSIMLLSSSRS